MQMKYPQNTEYAPIHLETQQPRFDWSLKGLQKKTISRESPTQLINRIGGLGRGIGAKHLYTIYFKNAFLFI